MYGNHSCIHHLYFPVTSSFLTLSSIHVLLGVMQMAELIMYLILSLGKSYTFYLFTDQFLFFYFQDFQFEINAFSLWWLNKKWTS